MHARAPIVPPGTTTGVTSSVTGVFAWGLLGSVAALVSCGPPGGSSTTPGASGTSRPVARRAAADSSPRRATPPLARCVKAQGGALPAHLRSVRALGGYRLLGAGLRASERPPCAGRCPPLTITLALVDGTGAICWRTELPDEHRLGPVGRPGGSIFVAGPRRVFALGWDGRRLATTVVEGLRGEPVALADGGAAFLDGEGHVVVFRGSGALRWRKRPQTPARPLALAARPGGGVLVAFAREVRGYDADGVELLTRALPDLGTERDLAALGPQALWAWSLRGAYRIGADGAVSQRLPPRAPKDGQLFAAALGPGGIFYALLAERGFHPVKLVAVKPSGAPHWSRPYTGARPARCHLTPGPKQQLAVRCEGDPRGRAVVRDPEGITRFDEELVRPQLTFGPDGAFAVAEDTRARDMSLRCRLRRFGPTGEGFRVTERAGPCPVLWSDATGAVVLGRERIGR